MDNIFFVSDLNYFASVNWYANALSQKKIILPHSNYNKSNPLNRTNLLSANGITRLSIPLIGGRSQHLPDNQVQISYAEDWRKQHLRSIATMYGRAAFFENIYPYLQQLYSKKFETLFDCNLECFLMIKKILNLDLETETTTLNPNHTSVLNYNITYNQVFKNNNTFTPNLSIIDLIINEGKLSKSILLNINE